MSFAERYAGALDANLQDDEHHHATGVLRAAAFADKAARDIGALLHRVKFSGTVIRKFAKAMVERERLENGLASAVKSKDEGRQAEFRDALSTNDAACAAAGGEGAEFRALLSAWREIVEAKGRERNWIKAQDWPKIGHLFPAMVERVAQHSLAHYLDGKCQPCGGTGTQGVRGSFKVCPGCQGSRKAKISGLNPYETHLIEDMISELEVLESSHAGVASALLRRAA